MREADDAWPLMCTHPEMSTEIIGHDDYELLAMAQVIKLTHHGALTQHEKWNGSGYPPTEWQASPFPWADASAPSRTRSAP